MRGRDCALHPGRPVPRCPEDAREEAAMLGRPASLLSGRCPNAGGEVEATNPLTDLHVTQRGMLDEHTLCALSKNQCETPHMANLRFV